MGFAEKTNRGTAFTLIELLVVIAIIAVLAALLLPVLPGIKAKAQRTTCESNLRQINLGLRMYCDDSNDVSPKSSGTRFGTQAWNNYRGLIGGYVGAGGNPSARDKLFACPADTYFVDIIRPPNAVFAGLAYVRASLFEQTNFDYSSYAFNGGAKTPFGTNSPGIAGYKVSSIKEPARTVLVAEQPAFFPYSWHQSSTPGGVTIPGGVVLFKDARNMVSFVDGHAAYTRIYWNSNTIQGGLHTLALLYDPPAGYEYRWSGD